MCLKYDFGVGNAAAARDLGIQLQNFLQGLDYRGFGRRQRPQNTGGEPNQLTDGPLTARREAILGPIRRLQEIRLEGMVRL
jgi:hypothetical protein